MRNIITAMRLLYHTHHKSNKYYILLAYELQKTIKTLQY
jgi:hypothetical protein